MRAQTDYCATFKTNAARSLKGLWDIHRSVCPRLSDFVSMLAEATQEKHACLWFDSRRDEVSIFKADVPPDFQVRFKNIGL